MATADELAEWRKRLETALPESVPCEGEPLTRTTFLETLATLAAHMAHGPDYRRGVYEAATTAVRRFKIGDGWTAKHFLDQAVKAGR